MSLPSPTRTAANDAARAADDAFWAEHLASMTDENVRAYARSMHEQYERVAGFHSDAADEVDRLELELVKVRSECDALRERLAAIASLAA